MRPTPNYDSVTDLLLEEDMLHDEATFRAFRERACEIRAALCKFVQTHRPLYAYGAAAKGNTLLNWCGIVPQEIIAVGDTTPAKQGKFLPGSRIPIISEAQLIERQPQTVLILPWNWRAEIVTKLAPTLPNTQFVTPMDLA